MKKEIMSDIKVAARKCLIIMHERFSLLKDPIIDVYKNDMNSVFKDIALYVFMNGEDAFDPELMRIIRNGIEQFQKDAYIITSHSQK